jgi:dihydrodipicolinate synthase/N-acetylneuraminate lyase
VSLTPFKEDFSLDEKGLRRNLQAFLEMGVEVV